MTDVSFCTIDGGGVASACGFKAGGIHAGFRDDPNRLDMALVEADELCAAAGVFTQNVFVRLRLLFLASIWMAWDTALRVPW